MPSIADIATTPAGAYVPRLTGGTLLGDSAVLVPQRHGQALANWARDHGVSEIAEVVCHSIRLQGRTSLYSPPADMRLTEPERPSGESLSGPGHAVGWGLALIDEDRSVNITLLEGGEVEQEGEPRDIPGSDRIHTDDAWAGRLRKASGREIDERHRHLLSRIARDVTIRKALADGGLGVQMVAQLTGLGDQRIYQIRDRRR
ncbi:hypothetical protein [Streptomyces nanshensis]|uniref:Uncharacterized protein n=1 Tax=Streptomyces nanshensis TaxID=518642 RepID=A0A1E7L708_9ACTN|nr:hypothetical protein [Streptomyces nanshensis]OEV11950.1 hypothetical protein AN218_10675 [Streptomyces nanshensis]